MIALLRLIALLGAGAIAVSVLLYLLTRQAQYLRFAWLAGKVLIFSALVFFGLMLVERLGMSLG